MNEKIKTLFFISSLAGGGAERVMVDLLRNIDRSRIEPFLVLLYSFGKSPYKDSLPDDLRIIVLDRKSDNFFYKIKQFLAFVNTVFKEKPLVIFSMLTHNNIMAILAGMLFKNKVIVSEHNTLGEVIKIKEGRKILGLPVAPLVKLLYRFADRVIAVSEGIKDNLIEEFNIDGHKIYVIYNPLDSGRIAELSGEPAKHPFFEDRVPVIMAVGRLAWQKGFDVLIKAFSMVIKEMDARLIIMGEGPEREPLHKLISDMGIEHKVSLTGFQGNPYKFLSKADVFVLSSVYEGLPMVILEAMACGVPVISCDCRSGPREILQNGAYGLLVPVRDGIALAKGIMKILKDGELRRKLIGNGGERVKDFSIKKIMKHYEKAIYEVADSKPGS